MGDRGNRKCERDDDQPEKRDQEDARARARADAAAHEAFEHRVEQVRDAERGQDRREHVRDVAQRHPADDDEDRDQQPAQHREDLCGLWRSRSRHEIRHTPDQSSQRRSSGRTLYVARTSSSGRSHKSSQ